MGSGKTCVFPSEDEEYMSENQLNYFRERLCSWRNEVIQSTRSFLGTLRETALRSADEVESSANQADMTLDFQSRQRQERLLEQIDYALMRIEEGEYGYCEETGEEIGLGRLLARPVATLSVEAQERRERLAGIGAPRGGGRLHPCLRKAA